MFRAVPGAGANYLTGAGRTKDNSWNAQKNNFGPQIGFAWSPTSLFGHGFQSRLVISRRLRYQLQRGQIAITANISGNPGLAVSRCSNLTTLRPARRASPLTSAALCTPFRPIRATLAAIRRTPTRFQHLARMGSHEARIGAPDQYWASASSDGQARWEGIREDLDVDGGPLLVSPFEPNVENRVGFAG